MSQHETSSNILFELGQIVATPGALEALDLSAVNAWVLLRRHQTGDWGDVPSEDAEENIRSVTNGWRILSSYPLNEDIRIWVITEADRSATTLLLPEEY
jgi:hypothetical protein